MTRYRLRPLVSDWDGEDLWVGALPHGPITRIQGVGALVLDLLARIEQLEQHRTIRLEGDTSWT